MNKILLILIMVMLNLNLGLTQTSSEIDSLLNIISETENSKNIINCKQAEKIMSFGQIVLPILAEFFTVTVVTNVKSECQERYLTKGEIAIILADRIEMMPYFPLTGVQNCLLTFCDNNPNLIEYYLQNISYKGFDNFKEKYISWLYNEERADWPTKLESKARKERIQMIHQLKKGDSLDNE